MKTLDEVIKALEICTSGYCSNSDGYCPYLSIDNDCDTRLRKLDALEYLKKLKRIEAKIEKIAIGNVEDTLSKMDNPPLTWDELKTMEGKPVWVEYDDHFPGRKGTKFKEWEVIDVIFDDRLVAKGEWDYHKNEMGHVWQAYRKARE